MLEELIEIFGWQGGTKHQALEQVRKLVRDSYKFRKLLSEVFYTVTPHVSNSTTDDLWGRMQSALAPANIQQQVQPDGAGKPLAG